VPGAAATCNRLAAIPLAAVAGLLFASTYERSRSTLLVSIEHALYGDVVFTVGLGSLFYSSARWLAH
jgi:CAAX protease family protein